MGRTRVLLLQPRLAEGLVLEDIEFGGLAIFQLKRQEDFETSIFLFSLPTELIYTFIFCLEMCCFLMLRDAKIYFLRLFKWFYFWLYFSRL